MQFHQSLLLLLAASALFSTRPAEASNVQGPYERGLLEVDVDHYEQAARLFTEAIAADPANADAFVQRARCEMDLGQTSATIADSNRALALDPQSAYAYSYRGYAELMMRNYRAGIDDCTKAIELHSLRPFDFSVSHDYENRDKALRMIRRPDLIGDDRTKLACLALVKRGVDAREAGQLTKAKAFFDQAIDMNPFEKSAWFLRGVVFSNMREFWKAAADFTHVIRGSPDSPVGYYFRADCYQQLGEHEKAIEDLTRIIDLHPRLVALNYVCETGRLRDHFEGKDVVVVDLADAYYLRAQSRLSAGDLTGASADLTEVMKLDPSDKVAFSQNADIALALGKSRKAIGDYDKAIENSPRDWQAYHQRAEAYERLGTFDKAIEDYTKIISLNPKDSGAYLLRARLYDKLNLPAEAIADYTTIITLNPTDDDAYRCRGLSYSKTKQYEKAIQDFTKAIALDPANKGSCYEARANAYKQLGKGDMALKDTQAADLASGERVTDPQIKNAAPKGLFSLFIVGGIALAGVVLFAIALWFFFKRRKKNSR